MAAQSELPTEIIVVDASTDGATEELCATENVGEAAIRYIKSPIAGAAPQRNIATAEASQPFICFLDDDVMLEPDCLAHLWRAINVGERFGGVSAMIVNQSYREPGRISRFVYAMLNGRAETSYAGKCIGPAINFLPEDRDDLPEVVPTEWLNLGCTIYLAEALPSPPFANKFKGYSLLEDLALSLTVGKTWKLANVRTARLFHDSQPAEHKADLAGLARMDFINRYYVMTSVMGRNKLSDHFRFFCWQLFMLSSALRSPKRWPALARGSFGGAKEVAFARGLE